MKATPYGPRRCAQRIRKRPNASKRRAGRHELKVWAEAATIVARRAALSAVGSERSAISSWSPDVRIARAEAASPSWMARARAPMPLAAR